MVEPRPVVPPGTVLDGKYIVERTLGEGGMGYVVAARHAVLQTRVAIKILLPRAMVEPDTVARFHREARSAVRIHSPHAARVHDVGTLSDGTPYMVMDLLTGKDLSALLDERGMLTPQETIDYARQALEAVHEAHALGIIHRDLKPANLFLADQPNSPPIVKVLDFGIARDFEEGNEQRLTQTRAVMGSPAYMSPEQMREARNADVRSDVWSMGVCLYELLTGRAPFEGASLPDLFVTVLHGTPVAPNALRGDLPPGLSDTILRCLEKDPARRFQSASELSAALQTGQSGASWPTTTTTTTTGHSSARSLVVRPERLATSRTLAEAPAPRSKLRFVSLAVVALGMMGFAIGAGALLRSRARVSTTTAPAPAQPAPEPSVPAPVDLSGAGAVPTNAAAPATGAAQPTAAAPSAGPSAPRASKIVVPPAPARSLRSGPVASAPAAPPPVLTPTPPAPPKFDPGKTF